jgi:hypothetical protein
MNGCGRSCIIGRMMHAFGSRGRAAIPGEPPIRRPRPLRRAVIAALAAFACGSVLGACANAKPPETPANAAREGGEAAAKTHNEVVAEPAPPPPPAELPRGGRTLFPDYRLVGFCGTPGAPALGSLMGNLTTRGKALEEQAARYNNGKRKLMPVFELIAVVVQSGAGPDGKYRRRVDKGIVDYYLKSARAEKALLLLNIQPGQSDFLTEVQAFESYLREPDVGVALDPEWAMKPKQTPGRFFGQTDGETINDVANYLAGIVKEGNLPEKALVFHQVNRGVLKDEPQLQPIPGVVFIKSVDGLGPVHSKIETYDYLMLTRKKEVHPGFKLFFDEDSRNGNRIMTPKEVLALTPQPEYVMYE